MEKLREWKNSDERKPLILKGARQVGKTWLMREFGRIDFDDFVYLNFDGNSQLSEIFSIDISPSTLIPKLEILSGKKIIPDKTLIIFDEVQEVPRALSSLKYFCEDAPEYHIVAAGSLLGIALHPGTSFPVGKVSFLDISPMTFKEFLIATGQDHLANTLCIDNLNLLKVLKDKYELALKTYYYVGGMPEVVSNFVNNQNFEEVRQIQKNILNAYEQDFSKHAPGNVVPKIRDVWTSIPSQLAKENKKFVYGLIRQGARAKEFEHAIMWLKDCGLVHQVGRVTSFNYPPAFYKDLKAFKLFFVDVGLLSRLSDVSPASIIEGDRLLTEYKGALTEQYVAQELLAACRKDLYYYTNDRNTCEIDFVGNYFGKTVPIEVKASKNMKAKSLKTVIDKYGLGIAIRSSLNDFEENLPIVNVPLYAMSLLHELEF